MQCGTGGAGVNTNSAWGYQAFPVPFTGYTPHVVCTMNASAYDKMFVIQVCNITTTGFNYSKRYMNNAMVNLGWGNAVGETFEWIAMIA
jgi:hypothetical protein